MDVIQRAEQNRREAERHWPGSVQEFLTSLEMRLSIEPARSEHLGRIRELVNRTNQLCRSYSEQELQSLLSSPHHVCWLVSLRDRFGDCGQIGIIVMELAPHSWTLQLMLFSCRVLPRQVDVIVLNFLLRRARAARVSMRALFRPSSRNESLWLAYRNAGFEQAGREGDFLVATHPLERIHPDPYQAELILQGA